MAGFLSLRHVWQLCMACGMYGRFFVAGSFLQGIISIYALAAFKSLEERSVSTTLYPQQHSECLQLPVAMCRR